MQKFVSTTLRPTLMPYPELYNWDTCAQFVSDFLFMEPLPDPLKPVSPRSLSWDLRGESSDRKMVGVAGSRSQR